MDKITIGVSGINAVDNPGPGVGVARSLKADEDLNVTIIGLAYDALEPGIYMDWLIDKSYIVPSPAVGINLLCERLMYIKANTGLDAIIPTLDVELALYTKYAREINNLGIKIFVPSYEQFCMRGKDKLVALAKQLEIKIPETIIVHSHEELSKAVAKIGLPVMIKGVFYGARSAYNIQEAFLHFNTISVQNGYPILVQKIISGEEMNVVGVGDGQGNSLGMIGIKKTWVTIQGKIWTGVTVKNDQMLKATQDFISLTKWRGAFELECILDGDDVYLIEINPRFPAWSHFATGVGVNLASNIVRKMFNLPLLSNLEYEAGKLYVRYTYELITDMSAFQKIIMLGEC